MRKFIYFLIARGYLSCRQQGKKRLVKLIIKNRPELVTEFLNRQNGV